MAEIADLEPDGHIEILEIVTIEEVQEHEEESCVSSTLHDVAEPEAIVEQWR